MTMGGKVPNLNHNSISNNSVERIFHPHKWQKFINRTRVNIKGFQFETNVKSETRRLPHLIRRSSSAAPCRSPSIPRRAGSSSRLLPLAAAAAAAAAAGCDSSSSCRWQLLPQAAAAPGCSRGCNGARPPLRRGRGPARAPPARPARRRTSPAPARLARPNPAEREREREIERGWEWGSLPPTTAREGRLRFGGEWGERRGRWWMRSISPFSPKYTHYINTWKHSYMPLGLSHILKLPN